MTASWCRFLHVHQMRAPAMLDGRLGESGALAQQVRLLAEQARSRGRIPSRLPRRACSQQAQCRTVSCSGAAASRAKAVTRPPSILREGGCPRRTRSASATGWTKSWTGRGSNSRPKQSGCVGGRSWLQVVTRPHLPSTTVGGHFTQWLIRQVPLVIVHTFARR